MKYLFFFKESGTVLISELVNPAFVANKVGFSFIKGQNIIRNEKDYMLSEKFKCNLYLIKSVN